jgi:hypothetical protein
MDSDTRTNTPVINNWALTGILASPVSAPFTPGLLRSALFKSFVHRA